MTHDLYAVLWRAVEIDAMTDGAFDPTVAPLVTLWRETRRTGVLPAPTALDSARALVGWRRVSLDKCGPLVRLEPGTRLDLGGIAKGYGGGRAAGALRRWGIARGVVNVGGDLYAIGRSEDGDPWRVGIRSPRDPDGLAGTIDVEDAAIATSGDYERFFEYRGRRYHHLLDQGTAAPRVSAAHSVTIRAASCLDADAAATAVFGLDPRGTKELLRAAGGRPELVESA